MRNSSEKVRVEVHSKSTHVLSGVSRRVGFPTSTIRYYERLGLLPEAARKSGGRQYTPQIFDRLKVIEFARATGFALAEIKLLFLEGKPYSSRMLELARAKLDEIEAVLRRAEPMKSLLRTVIRCRCVDVAACSRRLRTLA